MNRNLITVWHSNPDNITEEDKDALFAFLDRGEQERYEKIRPESCLRQYLLAHVLLRMNLFFRFDIHPLSWQLKYSGSRKPYIDLPGRAGIDFSISHTQGCVACAVSGSGKVGMDVELLEREIKYHSLAERCLTDNERYSIEKKSRSEQKYLFLKAWVLKEAYLKAAGTGLRRSLKDVEFDILSGRPQITDESVKGKAQWEFSFFHIQESHLAAVAVKKSETMKTELSIKDIPVNSIRSMIRELG